MRFLVVDMFSLIHAMTRDEVLGFENESTTEHIIDNVYSAMRLTKADEMVLAFDGVEGSAWRRDIYPLYKSSREPDMTVRSLVRDVFTEMRRRVHCEVLADQEADDVVATIVRLAIEDSPENQVVIYSRDRDYYAILQEGRVRQLREHFRKAGTKWMTASKMEEELQLKPSQWLDFRIMAGDPNDDIAGIPKIGEKTAMAILQKYGSLQEAIDNKDDLPITPSRKTSFIRCVESGEIEVLRQVLTMRQDVPVKWKPPSLRQANGI